MSASTQTWRWSSWSPIRRATQVDDRRPGGGGVTGGMLRPWTHCGSCAGGDEDEVGHEAGEESEDDAPGGDFLVTELAGDSQEFDHDVENRACGEGETRHEDRVIDERLADEVPTRVGPPPMSPRTSRNDHDGASPSAAIGATMPKPSVALCSPKPMMSNNARLTSPAAADWPM